MKLIILSAFGRLRSDVMEIPNELPTLRFHLAKKLDNSYLLGKNIPVNIKIDKIGTFEQTDKYEVLVNKRTARIYELVDVS